MADKVELAHGGGEKPTSNDAGTGENYELDQNGKKVSDFRTEAIDAEQVELNMTVPEAVRAYPMAAMWAFIMSCTIVS